MSEKHLIADIPLKAFIENDGKVLIMRAAGESHWQLPGGRMNEGEDLERGLKREIKEELNLDVEPGNIFDAFLFQSDSGKNHVALIFKCQIKNQLKDIKFNDGETEEIRWVLAGDIKDLQMPEGYKKALNKYFAFEGLLLKNLRMRKQRGSNRVD